MASGTASGQAAAFVYFAESVAATHWLSGRLAQVVDFIETPSMGSYDELTVVRAVQLAVLAVSGRTDRAHAVLAGMAAEGFRNPYQTSATALYASIAFALWELRDATYAATIREKLEPYSGMAVTTQSVWLSVVDLQLAQLDALCGDAASASKRFRQGLEQCRRLGNQPLRALAAVWFVDAILENRAHGGAAQAEDLLTQARTIASLEGLDVLAAQVDDLWAKLRLR